MTKMDRKKCGVLPEGGSLIGRERGTPQGGVVSPLLANLFLPTTPVGDDEVLLAAQQVCSQLRGISLMTLWRWLHSDVVQFPQPTVRINSRRYWSAGSIRRWLSDRRA
jgi:predicted DNA-binding transcriptional regulator AlpA